jgi:hypothetical protein
MRVRVFMSAVVATALFGSSAMAADPSHIRYGNYTMCAAYMQEQVQDRIDTGKPAEADTLRPAVRQLQTKALNQGALMHYSARPRDQGHCRRQSPCRQLAHSRSPGQT